MSERLEGERLEGVWKSCEQANPQPQATKQAEESNKGQRLYKL